MVSFLTFGDKQKLTLYKDTNRWCDWRIYDLALGFLDQHSNMCSVYNRACILPTLAARYLLLCEEDSNVGLVGYISFYLCNDIVLSRTYFRWSVIPLGLR